jgi:hypothetical protein
MNERQAHAHHRANDPGYFEVVTTQIQKHAEECADNLPKVYVSWTKVVLMIAGVMLSGAAGAWVISERISVIEQKIAKWDLVPDKIDYLIQAIDHKKSIDKLR